MQPGVADALGRADDGGDQHARLGDQRAAGFGTEPQRVGQVALDGSADAGAVVGQVRDWVGVAGRKPAADVEHAQGDAMRLERAQDARALAGGVLPGPWIGHLRPDVEGDAVGLQAERPGVAHEVDRLAARHTELPFAWDFAARAVRGQAASGRALMMVRWAPSTASRSISRYGVGWSSLPNSAGDSRDDRTLSGDPKAVCIPSPLPWPGQRPRPVAGARPPRHLPCRPWPRAPVRLLAVPRPMTRQPAQARAASSTPGPG
jgi:hypothetical protein